MKTRSRTIAGVLFAVALALATVGMGLWRADLHDRGADMHGTVVAVLHAALHAAPRKAPLKYVMTASAGAGACCACSDNASSCAPPAPERAARLLGPVFGSPLVSESAFAPPEAPPRG